MKRVRQILFAAERHRRKALAVIFHQPQKRPVFPDGVADVIVFLPNKAFQEYAVARIVMAERIKRHKLADVANLYPFKL